MIKSCSLIAFALIWTGCVSSRPQEVFITELPSSSVYERGQPVITPDGPGEVVQPLVDSSHIQVALTFRTVGSNLSNIYPADSIEALSPELHRINRQAYNRKATLLLSGGETMRVRRLQIRPDATSWLDPDTQQLRSIATAQVQEVHVRSHGRGLREGLGFGVVVAVGIGALIGIGGRSDCGVGEELSCGLGYLAIGTLGAGLLTVPIGGLLGAAAGHHAVYQFTGHTGPGNLEGSP